MTRLLLSTFLLAQVIQGSAQVGPLAERHSRIQELQRQGDHAGVVEQITLQLNEAQGTPWQDSLHAYVYAFGRATWKSQNADAGVAALQRLTEVIMSTDPHAPHKLDALEARGRLFSDIGRMEECVHADSIAMVFAESHKDIPLVRRGRVHQRLGLDHSDRGDFGRSLRYYQQAQSIYERSDTLLAMALADVHNGMGAAYWHLGELRKAEEQYRLALAFLEKSLDVKRHFRMASMVANIGILWQSNGDFQRSRMNYMESIRICGAVADTAKDPLLKEEAILMRTRGYVNLATVYFGMGDDGRSRELLEMALHDRERYLEPDDPKLLGVKDRLADLEMEAHNYARAEEWVLAYLEACEKYHGVHSENYIRTCAKLGEVHVGLGRFVSADSLFKRSISLSEGMREDVNDADLALAYRRHAQFYMEQRRYEEAIAELERALVIIKRLHGDAHHKVAMYELVLADAAFSKGDAALTLRLADHALGLLQDRVQALRTSRIPQTWPQPYLLPDALYWKVKAERALGVHAPERWRQDMDLGMTAMDRNRSAYDDEGSQLGFIGQEQVVFHQAVELAGEDHARSGAEADLDRFLALTEADRSILLRSRLNDFAAMGYAGVPDSVIAQEKRLVEALELDPEDRAATADLIHREEALAAFLERLSQDHPNYFNLRYGDRRITLKDLRTRLLSPQRDLLCYALTKDHLFLLVVGVDTAALVRVPGEGITEAAEALSAAVRARDQKAYARSATDLYGRVFAPVEHLLRKPELLIIADGPLRSLNFETLLSGSPGQGRLSDRMLIRKYAIAYLLSATTAVRFKELSGPRSKKVLAFAPGFSDELKQGYLAHVPDPAKVDQGFLNYVRQPFAVSTAEALGSLVSARVSIGADASEKHFREEAGSFGVLHLGTHAEMNAHDPLYSRLVLSKDGSGVDPDADGYLHAYEIYELDLRAQLAVLTACETGVGTVDPEGVRSLGYSFAYAGCPSLVMSLWSIDEKVSSDVIARFYGYLAEGMPKHIALQRAKLDHLDAADEELAQPYYWAGLVLVGDVEPVALASSWPHYLWWGMGLSALLIGLYLWRRKKK